MYLQFDVSILVLLVSKKIDIIPQQLRVPSQLQHIVKAMYTNHAKVWINGNTHGEQMSNIGAKQGCPLSPTLVGLYIDELETNLKEINMDSLCLFGIVVVIFLYVYVDVLLSKFGVGLQKLLSKVYEIYFF